MIRKGRTNSSPFLLCFLKWGENMTELREEVKKVLRDKSDDNNDYYDIVIPLLQEIAENRTGRKFDEIPGGLLFVAKAAEYLRSDMAISSKTLGDLTIQYAQNALPESIMSLLPPRKWVVL